jgi:hypothetical protein
MTVSGARSGAVEPARGAYMPSKKTVEVKKSATELREAGADQLATWLEQANENPGTVDVLSLIVGRMRSATTPEEIIAAQKLEKVPSLKDNVGETFTFRRVMLRPSTKYVNALGGYIFIDAVDDNGEQRVLQTGSGAPSSVLLTMQDQGLLPQRLRIDAYPASEGQRLELAIP